MPNSQLQNIDQNGNGSPNQPQPQPRRPSSGLYGMLRKTKNKTYSALRGTARTPDRQGSMNKLDEAAVEDESPDAKKRTPKMVGSNSDGLIQPPTSFFSPQNSWVGSHRKSRGGIVMDGSVAQKNVEDVVAGVESSLRKLVICCAIFIAGTMMPERVGAVQKLLELSMVAWGTCLAIISLVWFQKMQERKYYAMSEGQEEQRQIDAFNVGVVSPNEPPDIQRRVLDAQKAARAAIDHSESDQDLTLLSRHLSRDERKLSHGQIEAAKQKPLTPSKATRAKPAVFMPKHLEQLEDLYIMLVGKQERISPNGVAVKIETDLFYGDMLLMFRTSDVDEPPPVDGNEDPVRAYLRGKQRRFEFQWQLRLKKVPTGDVYVGLDLDEPPAMGMIQRALVNTALKFVKKMNMGFGYHFSDSSDSPSYLAFPVGTSMDRFVATKPGDKAPKLGKEIFEDPDTMKKRKKGAQIEWNTDDTYTMALWSAYFDWVDWQILNFPGIRPFSATSVAGVQPIKMNMYMIPNEDSKERNIIFAIEVSNSAKAALGNEAKAWKANHASVATGSAVRVLQYNEEASVNEHGDDDIDDDNSEEEDEDAEDAEIEELGMGRALSHIDPSVYVTSGSCLSLREGVGSFVASGGGYAVLQSSSTSVIVLEKVFRSKKTQKSRMVPDPHLVIRNGDIVRVKLVTVSSNTSKYLCIHRGWWLRWTSNRPTKTSSFYIRTNESDATALLFGTPFSLRSRKWSSYHVGVCNESSAKYGGRMLAMYKAGKTAAEEEPPINCDEDDEPIDDEDCKDFIADKPMKKPIMPLHLCAESIEVTDAENASPPKRSPTHSQTETQSRGQFRLDSFSSDMALTQYELDCPVWLEVMNRATRATQLVYAVRVKETSTNDSDPKAYEMKRQSSEISESDAQTDSGTEVQGRTNNIALKLRSGREIASLLSKGARHKDSNLAWEITNLQVNDDDGGESGLVDFSNPSGLQRADSFSSSSSDDSDDEVIEDEQLDFLIAGPDNSEMNEFLQTGHDSSYAAIFPEDATEATNADSEIARRVSEDDLKALEATDKTPGKAIGEKDRLYMYDASTRSLDASAAASEHPVPTSKSQASHDRSGSNDYQDNIVELTTSGHIESKKKSKTKVLNRVAKTVKSSTVITGKQVLKQSKKVGKATVSTGRAAGRVIPNSYKPPKKHEPGGGVFSAKKPPKKNSIKWIGRALKNIEGQYYDGSELHSGQLSALDQSKVKISQILSQLSTNRSSAICEAISSFILTNSDLDKSFLIGSSAELGVIPLKPIDTEIDYDCICARGIWDGRWREELCVMYRQDSHIAFYEPLSRKPSLVIGFEEISSVRKCDSKTESNPLPGLSLVALDTAWRCTYLAFLTDSDRENFTRKLNDAMYHADTNGVSTQTRKVAAEWESYKMSLETSLTGSGGKWASVTVGKKSKQKRQRRMFNARRMTFDLEPIVNGDNDGKTPLDTIALFVENLLHKALGLSANALDSTTQTSFTEFLDEASRLRSIPLHEIDYESTEALCIFVNLYHCLLQHALLFAVDGLPDKRSVTRFKRCSCYEIGGDVFSLAELECCVIRGKLSKAVHLKPPLVDVTKKSRTFLQYALDAADNRVNFFVNNGSLDYPSEVPVLKCETFENQVQAAASSFLRNQIKINVRKRVVFLPKVCDVYRNDFGMGDCLVCLSQILRYLDESSQLTIASLLENGGQIIIKFHQPSEKFHTNLSELLE